MPRYHAYAAVLRNQSRRFYDQQAAYRRMPPCGCDGKISLIFTCRKKPDPRNGELHPRLRKPSLSVGS